MTLSEDIPHFIISDEQRIGQVLANIVGNAVKFTFQGQINFVITFDELLNYIVFEVIDTGKGIENLEAIG